MGFFTNIRLGLFSGLRLLRFPVQGTASHWSLALGCYKRRLLLLLFGAIDRGANVHCGVFTLAINEIFRK